MMGQNTIVIDDGKTPVIKLHPASPNGLDGFNLTFAPGTPLINAHVPMTLESPVKFMANYGMPVQLVRSDKYAELPNDPNFHTTVFVVNRDRANWTDLRKKLYVGTKYVATLPTGTKVKIAGIPTVTSDDTEVEIPIDAKFDICIDTQLHPVGSDLSNDLVAISFGYTSDGKSYPFAFASGEKIAWNLFERRERAKKIADSKKEDDHISCANAASDETIMNVIAERYKKNPDLLNALLNKMSGMNSSQGSASSTAVAPK